MLKRDLISERYRDDGSSLRTLNDIQKDAIGRLKSDARICYETVEQCPLCGNADFTLIAEKDRYAIPLRTVVCDRCGLIFTYRRMTAASARIFYSEYYRHIYEGVANPTRESLEERYRIQEHGRIPKFLRPGSVIVEIGSGGGWNLVRFHKKGFKHYGFDYDERYLKFGREEHGLDLRYGGVDEAKALGLLADYVILTHVLEHTTEPLGFVASLQEIMKDRAILTISLPSASLLILGGGTVGHDLLGTLQNAHNFLFDEYTLRFLARMGGYEIVTVLGENMVVKKNVHEKGGRSSMDRWARKGSQRNNRGSSVIGYLKMCERLLPAKNRIRGMIGEGVFSKLPYVYYLFSPLDMSKKYLMYGLGMAL